MQIDPSLVGVDPNVGVGAFSLLEFSDGLKAIPLG
jgi:hypothetical protein